jgi:selenocysteine lyase/cysteine desulfurase
VSEIATAPPAESGEFDGNDWSSVRRQFLLTPEYAHFSAFMLAAHPAPVRAAVARVERILDERPQEFGLGMHDLRFGALAREALTAYTGGTAEQVALTDSATMGLGLLYGGFELQEGDEILTTEHEFYSTRESIRLRARRDKVTVRTVRLYDNPATVSADELVGKLVDAIGPRTKVLALTWVHSSTGVKLPLREICAAVEEVNMPRSDNDRVLVCVDGVHGFAVEDAIVADLGCDFFVTSTHKWLFGPRGTGFVWARPDVWRRIRPIVPSFSKSALVRSMAGLNPAGPPGELNSPGGYHSYSARWAVPAAVRFHSDIGLSRIAEYTKTQAIQLKAGLAELPHVRVVTPADPALSSGIVCCSIDGLGPDEAADRLLREHGVSAGATPYRESLLRIGPSMVTTPEEVEHAVRAVAALR